MYKLSFITRSQAGPGTRSVARINAISNVTFMTFYMASKNNEHIVGLCSQFDIAPAHTGAAMLGALRIIL